MRLNQYLALHTDLSRRGADVAINEGRVVVNGLQASIGQIVAASDRVFFDGEPVRTETKTQLIILNKPTGYICSRRQQGRAPTIYALLPYDFINLKPVGRLDKDSSGLLVLTNDGILANELTHPSFRKWKTYTVKLDKPLSTNDIGKVKQGIELEDGISKMDIISTHSSNYEIRLQEGRNRQIRRTFNTLGYRVVGLHRTKFGDFNLGNLASGKWKIVTPEGRQ